MTERVVEYRIRNGGPWRILLPGVYLTHAGLLVAGLRGRRGG